MFSTMIDFMEDKYPQPLYQQQRLKIRPIANFLFKPPIDEVKRRKQHHDECKKPAQVHYGYIIESRFQRDIRRMFLIHPHIESDTVSD